VNTELLKADLDQIMPLLVIWGAACLLLLGDVFLWRRNKEWNPLLAAGALLLAMAMTFARSVRVGDAAPFAGSLRMDALGQVSTIALLVTGILSVLLSWTYLRNRGLDHGEYYVLLLLSTSGAILMAVANDLIVLFLGLEVLSFALYVMAGFARTDEKSEEASIKYFLLGAFASAFLLYGIALMYGATQSTDLQVIAAKALNGTNTPMMLAGIALLVVGLGFKAAVIPFHQWTPDVYEGAPTSVTAYMAGAAKIGAFAAILRVFDALIPDGRLGLPSWLPAIQVIAILTMVVGNLLAVTQTNLKRMLAYSSIAHAGYLLVAVAAMGHKATGPLGASAHGQAFGGALFYLFAYTFMTLGAFGVLVYLSGRGRDYHRVEDLRGLARHDPKAAYAMMFFMLSLGGIPPTMGFVGKWQIFLAAMWAHEYLLSIVMALASVIAVYYYLRVVWIMIFEEPTEETPAPALVRGPALASVMISAVATLLFGIVPSIINYLTITAK
jgi:NADH-quinone oxidoreductase subunit N